MPAPDRVTSSDPDGMRVIGAREFYQLVSVDDAREAVGRAFVDFSAGHFVHPQRLVSADGTFLAMACIDAQTGVTVTKVMTVRPSNRQQGLPSHHSVVSVFDGSTGQPIAVIDGNAVTIRRTGAASGVATALLSPPTANSLAVIGAGAQAGEQVSAVLAVRPIEQVRLASRSVVSAQALRRRLIPQYPDVEITAVETAMEAVDGVDVVCCVTDSTEPLFRTANLSPSAHVNALGAFRPDMKELATDIIEAADVVVVDSLANAGTSGDLLGPPGSDFVAPELLEIGRLIGRWTRPRAATRTCFKSVGLAAQDFAVATLAIARVRA